MEKGHFENPPNRIPDSSLIEKKINYSPIEKIIFKSLINKEKNFTDKNLQLIIPLSKIENKINPIKIIQNPNYLNFNTIPAGFVLHTKAKITANNIAQFAFPLAQFIEQVRPEYIIACDRGARIIALAVHLLYQKLYGSLPTQDHAIHFRKISKRASRAAVRNTLKVDVQNMLDGSKSPTCLVLDDWVYSGGTKKLVEDLIAELSGGKVKVLYGVMRGGGGDVSGKQDSSALGDWHDRNDIIGVDHESSTLEPHAVRSPLATEYRQRMSKSITKFVEQFILQPTH